MHENINYNSFTNVSSYFKKIDYNYYWKFLLLIGAFYILPSVQFVIFQYKDYNSTQICYYNNKCKKDFYFIPAFNNVISNILYILFGLIYIIVVKTNKINNDDPISCGINNSKAIYYSLGLIMIFEGLCSSIFHLCPSVINFQFDTTFMFLGCALTFISIYQKRHIAPYPMKVYSLAALLIFFNTLPIYGLSTELEICFWICIFLIMSYIMIFGSIHLYYDMDYDFDISSFKTLYYNFKNIKKHEYPKLILICMINGFTMGMYIYATITKPNFTDWLLGVSIINLMIYFIYYLILKVRNKEKISTLIWVWIVIDIITISISLVFFLTAVSNKFLPMEESNSLNSGCVLFNYFDYHDIWHIVSSIGLFIFINIIFFIDNNIEYTVVQEINIF
jgi:hypothetical protein